MSTSSQLCSLAEGVICKVQEVGKLCKVKNDYIKWIKYLNRTIGILRKYIRFNVSAVNKKHFLKLESSVSLLKGFKQQFNHRKNISEPKKPKFIKPSSGDEDSKHFQTKNRVIDHNTDLNIYYDDHIQNNILNKLEEFQERD
nr:unnamed protein product [Callosobruchus chinensis]